MPCWVMPGNPLSASRSGNSLLVVDLDPNADLWIKVSVKQNQTTTWVHVHVNRERMGLSRLVSPMLREKTLEPTDTTTILTFRLFSTIPHTGAETTPLPHHAEVPVDEIWRLLHLTTIHNRLVSHGGRYEVPARLYADWFFDWSTAYLMKLQAPPRLDKKEMQKAYASLLFPCLAFMRGEQDFPKFAHLTKRMVYGGIDPLVEHNPIMSEPVVDRAFTRSLRMPKAIIQTLVEASRFLHNKIQDRVHELMESITCANCPCRIEAFGRLERALENTGEYPLKPPHQSAVDTKLEQLGKLQYAFPEACDRCKAVGDMVKKHVAEVEGLFDGLCVVCMHMSLDPRCHEEYKKKLWASNDQSLCGWHGHWTCKYSWINEDKKPQHVRKGYPTAAQNGWN